MRSFISSRLHSAALAVFLSVSFVVANINSVSAFDETFYSGNNILFYNPDSANCNAVTAVADTELKGSENLEKIFNYMTDHGLTDIQAAGVVGNISQESGGDPENIQNPAGRTKDPSGLTAGWGIIQWTPGSKILGIAKDMGITGPIYELSTQLDILWGHMEGTSPTGVKNMLEGFKKVDEVEAATIYFEDRVEGAGTPNMTNRIAMAILALKKYGGDSSTSPAFASTVEGVCQDDTGPGASEGNIVQTAINYSWPEYHSQPYVKMKPSYAKAVSEAKSNGEYIGGIRFPGVDCGGFITRVMRNSGADPDYNNKEGNTDYQLEYLRTSSKYKEVNPSSTADLRPGDIAIRDGHTYMYVGKQPGFETRIASASLDGRAPMAGSETPADPSYQWFRLQS